MRIRSVIAVWILTAGAPLVTAQTGPTGGWLIEVIGDPVSPSNPPTTVRVSTYFPSVLWAFNTASFDLIGSDTNATFSTFMIPEPLGPLPPGPHGCIALHVGTTVPGGVTRVAFNQINILGCLAHSGNPLPIFETQWTTSDFSPRQVQLETLNTPRFHVFPDPGATLNTIDLVALNQFRHGSAVIQVIPAPSGAFLLACGGAMGWRRRRSDVS